MTVSLAYFVMLNFVNTIADELKCNRKSCPMIDPCWTPQYTGS